MKVRDRAKSFHRFSLRGFRRIRFVLDTEGDMSDNLRVSTIIQPSDGKPNRYHNFDAIRLWSATAVIFSHSFIIAEGSEKRELIQAVTGEIAGMYGVYVFFVLSGFLITRSKLTSTSTISYLWKRFLRVYPAYFGSITIVVLLAAPFFSSEAIANYYLRKSVWDGILNGLVFNTEDYYVYGVSFYRSDSNLGNTLNSVLWTIQTEVLLYVCIAILHALRLLRMEMMALIAILAILAHLSKSYLFTNLWDYAYLNWWGLTVGAPGFFTGAFLYFLIQNHRPRRNIALGLAVASLILPCLNLSSFLPWSASSSQLFAFLSAYPILWLGYKDAPKLGAWTRFGDLPYGLYVFGWPVQQVLRALLGEGWSGWAFFAVCFPVAVVAAWLSWTLIESRALRYRKLVR
jgi:peptidoglycan/LPS O-acetylase OafA/YrhL